MARNVTLSALRDAIRFQSDLIGATVRHTEAQLTTLINTSIQHFREEISNDGNTHYLVPYSGTLTTGATSPYSFLSLDLSAISPSIVRTYGFDVTVDNVVHSLDHRPFTERNIWSGPATTGIPRHWAHYQTAKIAIQPAPNSAYPYTLWYLPVLADLSADGDTFNGVSGWEDWIVWDVVCRLLIRDQQSAAFGVAKTYRDDTWARIKRQATRVSSAGGAVVGRDTLRGRIPDPLAARQAVMAGGGPPATHSITLGMLAEQTGPIFLGVVSGTGDVTAMTPAQSAGILPVFTPSAAGLVPAAGGSSTTKFLSQAGTFETVSSGGGGGSPGGPTGSIQIHGLSGFVGLTGFAVQGAPPSMTVRLPGTLRVTGGSVEVGSGTVRMSASGIDMGGGQLANVASLFGFPTFAAGVPGLVPASDNDSAKFLNGAGGFSVPAGGGSPGGSVGEFQFNNGVGGFGGASGVKVVASGTALNVSSHLSFGVPDDGVPNIGAIRFGSGASSPGMIGINPSGAFNTIFLWSPEGAGGASGPTVTVGRNAGSIGWVRNEVATGGYFSWHVGHSGFFARLLPTGFDLSQFHVNAKSLTLGSGIANDTLAQMPSGTLKAALTLGVPGDVKFPTLAAFFPTMTTGRAGLAPPGDGNLANFLRGDGQLAAPTGFVWNPTGLPNANLEAMPSGTVKANLTGTGAPSDVSIPTLMMHFPTFTTNRAGLVPRPGSAVGFFLRDDATWTTVENANLGSMPSGTVKAQITAAGTPNDVRIPTLAAFFPTFTSNRAGLVAPGDGDTSKFLNGAGAFTTPVAAATPGGVSGNFQFNNAGAMGGASGFNIAAGGAAVAIGPVASVADRGDMRVASGFMLAARSASGVALPMLEWLGQTGMFRVGSSGLPRMLNEVASGGVQEFGFGGATASTARLTPTGFDLASFHIAAKSMDVGSINGLPFDFAGLKRFPSLYAGSSFPSGVRLYVPRGNATGGNRLIIPSGHVGAARTITVFPSGARGGQVVRIERQDSSGFDVSVATPTGMVLHVFGSGVRGFADFMFTKPSGTAFELAGHGDLF